MRIDLQRFPVILALTYFFINSATAQYEMKAPRPLIKHNCVEGELLSVSFGHEGQKGILNRGYFYAIENNVMSEEYQEIIDIETHVDIIGGKFLFPDFDGDGDKDLVIVYVDRTDVYRNNGTFPFELVSENVHELIRSPLSYVEGDLDNDDEIEIFISRKNELIIGQLSHSGGISYERQTIDGDMILLGLEDIDDSGYLNLIYTIWLDWNTVYFDHNDGSGFGGQSDTLFWDNVGGIYRLADTDFDGKQELLYFFNDPNSNGQILKCTEILDQNTSLVFEASLDSVRGIWQTSDLNDDGELDFVFNHEGMDNAFVLLRSNGNFIYHQSVVSVEKRYDRFYGFLDLKSNLFFAEQEGVKSRIDVISVEGDSIVSSNGLRAMSPVFEYGDQNGDGKMDFLSIDCDFALISTTEGYTIEHLELEANYNFVGNSTADKGVIYEYDTMVINDIGLRHQDYVLKSDRYFGLRFFDLPFDYDDDGLTDILSMEGSDLIALVNNGGKSVEKKVIHTLSQKYSCSRCDVQSIDLDGNDEPELVISGFHDGQHNYIRILKREANATYVTEKDVQIDEYISNDQSVYVFPDLNSDGKGDLIRIGFYSTVYGVSTAFFNFTPFGSLPTDLVEFLFWADFDKDGQLDLLGFDLMRDYKIALADLITYNELESPRSIGTIYEISDFDGDEDLDIVSYYEGGVFLTQNISGESTSLDEKEKLLNNLELSPNPASQCIKIVPPSDFSGDGQVHIFEMTGRLVQSHHYYPECVDISNLSSGTYFILLRGAEANYISKIMKVD